MAMRIQRIMRTRRAYYILSALLVLALILGVFTIVHAGSRSRAIITTDEWPSYLFNDANSAYNSKETVITSATAPQLTALWTTPTSTTQPATSQAVTNNGLIYWMSRDGTLHVTDQSGNASWSVSVASTSSPGCGLASIGQTGTPEVATETINGTQTTVVYATAGANVAAYNATSHAQLWKTTPLTGAFLWSSPVVYNGDVYVGVGSRKCPDSAGEVVQLNATTGAVLHTFNTVPAGCVGATVDDTPAIDETLGLLYVLTGRAGTCTAGLEHYANSVIALNTADLTLVDYWQAPQDFHAAPTLFNATINGVVHQMIGAEQISGTFYAWDRTNLSAGPLWQANIGQSSTYYYQTAAAWDGTSLYVGSGPTTINATNCAGGLRALDPATGNFLWQACLQSGAVAGSVSAVPGVAFVGAGNSIVALSTLSGAVLDTYTDSNTGSSYVVAPSVANGMVVGGNMDGTLVALAPSGVTPTPTATSSVSPTPTMTPSATSTPAPLPCVRYTAPPPTPSGSDDWSSYMYGSGRSSYNTAETTITPSNVSGIKLHWTFTASNGPTPIFSQPATGNGMIYFGAFDGCERAVDQSGNLIWSTPLGQNNNSGCDPNPLGVVSSATVTTATVNGTPTSVVIVGGTEGTVFELNALTGAIIWQTSLRGTAGDTVFIWSSPAVYNGAIYIGRSAQECPEQTGQVDMLDLNSGTLLHSFDITASPCQGAGVWASPVIDSTLNRVYVVTGNRDSSCTAPQPYADGIVSLSATDLSYVDSWQVPLADQGTDSDFGATPTLFTATINGVVRQMIGAVKKSGFFYAWDRTNLSAGPLWATNIGVHSGTPYSATGDAAQVGQSGGNGAQSAFAAGVSDVSNGATQNQQAFAPTSGYSYISPAAFDGTTLYVAGGHEVISGATGCKGSLNALNPATGAFIWQDCFTSGPVLGAVTLIPGIAVVDAGAKIYFISITPGATYGHVLATYLDSLGGTASFFWGSSSVANGLVMQGNQDGTLTVLGL